MKCQIEWIDDAGKPTPDSNEAVGIAICKTGGDYHMDERGRVIGFPICEEHARRLKPYHVAWPGTPDEIVTEWKFIRF